MVRDCFPEGEAMNFFVNFFEGCNKGIKGKETEGRGSMVKWGNTPLEGDGLEGGM